MTALIKETIYHASSPFRVMILSPHCSSGENFFKEFPEILKHEKIIEKKEEFLKYIELEKDSGTTELCHKIAEDLEANGIGSIVIELDYPRAILDGGRVLEKCIRDALPRDLGEQLNSQFLAIHQKSLDRLLELYAVLNTNKGLILDVHTMASYCPMYKGTKQTKTISFDALDTYLRQYFGAPKEESNIRYFDLITSDVRGMELGDKKLKSHIEQELHEAGIPYMLNKPYAASDEFLMYPNLTHCRGLCFDIPKHSLSTYHADPEGFDLANIELDEGQLEIYAALMTRALIKTLEE